MKIWEAVNKVLDEAKEPLTSREIYTRIVDNKYYSFKARNPLGVVNGEIRRRCDNLDFPSANELKLFTRLADGRYSPIGVLQKSNKGSLIDEENEHFRLEVKLERAHENYLASLKKVLLEELKNLTPEYFEVFSKNLLKSYGFESLSVTKKGSDGGIDGTGTLKAGLSKLSVAFQCKRWKGNNVGRVEIDKFRGAIQGQFDQGVFLRLQTLPKRLNQHQQGLVLSQ